MTLEENKHRIQEFENLKGNWDSYGAKPIHPAVIGLVRLILPGLVIQPEIFPTSDGNIQLEYGDKIELEISPDGLEVLIPMNDNTDCVEIINELVRVVHKNKQQ